MAAAATMPPPTMRRESHATVTTGYSAVSFVPTEYVQTAVSTYEDHVVIDMLIPPMRYLPPTLTVSQLTSQIQDDLVRELEKLGLGLGSRIASVAHPRSQYAEAEQFIRDASGHLIDPALLPQNHTEFQRARLGIRSLRGEPLLTYFPSPAPAKSKVVNGVPTTCPCVCCRSGCVGADPRTRKLAVIPEALAKDVHGRTIVNVSPESAAPSWKKTPSSTSKPLSSTLLGEPFTEAKKPAVSKAPPSSSKQPASLLTSRSTSKPQPQLKPQAKSQSQSHLLSPPQPQPQPRPTLTKIKPAKSLNDLRRTDSTSWTPSFTSTNLDPTPPVPTVPTDYLGSSVSSRDLKVPSTHKHSRVILRPGAPSRNAAASAATPAPETSGASADSQLRAQKGMSLFAPLQMSDELRAALTLTDLGPTYISPDLNRRTPPLSSPSSLGSTPRVRDTSRQDLSLSPPDTNIDATITPIAARYSRSMSNLRQKAHRDQEIPPIPSIPHDLALHPSPDLHHSQGSVYPGSGARMRIISGQVPYHRREGGGVFPIA